MNTSKTPGSVILNDFRAAMELARAGGSARPILPRRSFTAANTDRIASGWASGSTAINSLLESSLEVIRERSRRWARNDEHGKRFTTLVKNGIVGPNGYTLKMQSGEYVKAKGGYSFKLDVLANMAIQSAWKKFCLRRNCDVTEGYSFTDLCQLTAIMTARDGEYTVREVRGGRADPYRLQILAIDRLGVRTRQIGAGKTDIRMGVEYDASGRAVRYHLHSYLPTDPQGGGASQRVEAVAAKDLIHDFIRIDPEQLRGVPWAHAALLSAHLLHGFEESAVLAARTGASHMGFYVQSNDPLAPIATAADLGAKSLEDQLITDVEPGALELLPKGITDFKSFDAKYPSEAFAPFANNRKQTLAAGLDVTYHGLTGDMTKVNYSSARIAELAERDNWRGLQQWHIGGFVRRVFVNWLEANLLAGNIKLPNGSALPVSKLDKFVEGIVFQARGWDWVDPLNEAKASQLGVQEGFISRTQVVAARGGDFEENVLELKAEQELCEQHEVKLGAPGLQAMGAAQPAGDAADPADPPEPKQPEETAS